MKSELDTLFLPFEDGLVDLPFEESEAFKPLFLNARYHAGLKALKSPQMICQQVFKPYVDTLDQNGFETLTELDLGAKYPLVLVLSSKNQRESENLLAKGLMALDDSGVLVMAAHNKSGGTRLKKMFQKLGFDDIAEHSKNKARVVWAQKPDAINDAVLQDWLRLDEPQDIADGYRSRLGLYGWDKIDKGSAILAKHLPQDLKGKGADFGCGYGYLSRVALEKNRKIKSMDYIDADARALDMCAENIADFDISKNGFWLDLSVNNPAVNIPYDFIIMNPPFHVGKAADSDIGVAFIKNAARALRKKGQLWLVANAHLPYERALDEYFFNTRIINAGAGGFKVLCAYK